MPGPSKVKIKVKFGGNQLGSKLPQRHRFTKRAQDMRGAKARTASTASAVRKAKQAGSAHKTQGYVPGDFPFQPKFVPTVKLDASQVRYAPKLVMRRAPIRHLPIYRDGKLVVPATARLTGINRRRILPQYPTPVVRRSPGGSGGTTIR